MSAAMMAAMGQTAHVLTQVPIRPALGPAAYLRFGSKEDIGACPRHVRFTPESGHELSAPQCPLCAKSGHFAALFNYLVGETQ
jgi:hypothetical protein